MIINTERLPNANILTPAVRRLDASIAATFKATVTEEIGSDRKALIVDFSKVDFIGGVRAVVPEKNVLVDYAFKGALENEYQKFQFRGGVKGE